MATGADVIRELMRTTEKLARKVAYEPTGVVPGFHVGPNITVTEDGRLRYVQPPDPIVELELAETTVADTHEWTASIVTDTQSICAVVSSYVEITIPSSGYYTFRHVANIGATGDGWKEGDLFQTLLYVNGSDVDIVAEIAISADTASDQSLSGSTTRLLTAGDVVVAWLHWENTLTTATDARGVLDDPPVSAFTMTQL
jgi:hypothetical protein